MSSVVVDTHAVVWFLTDPASLSPTARAAMIAAITGGDPVLVSAVTIAEVVYLTDKGKLPPAFVPLLLAELRRPGGGLRVVTFDLDVAEAMQSIPRRTVPDMPDRMIAATALRLGLPLVTADANIRASAVPTIW